MKGPKENPKNKSCDICGSDVKKHQSTTCSVCKSTCVHTNCITSLLQEVSEHWVCGECSPRVSKNAAGLGRALVNLKQHAQPRRQKFFETSKVKYVSNEESEKLLKKGKRKMRPQSFSNQSTAAQSNVISSMSQSKPSKLKSGTVAMSGRKANSSTILSGVKRPKFCGNSSRQRIQKINQPAYLEKPKGSKTLVAAEHEPTDAEERDMLIAFFGLSLYRSCFPPLKATWKGRFANGTKFIHVHAQSPHNVHRKTYTYSKMLPDTLKVHFIRRSKHLRGLFLDGKEVGLYFLPDENIEESSKYYDLLFGYMVDAKKMLRSLIHGVWLLIFTCDLLDSDAQREVIRSDPHAQKFLLGVFCPK